MANQTQNTLEKLMQDPSLIVNLVKDPGKYGMDMYNGLTNKQKQYLLIAAGVGLIGYGIYVGRQLDR